MRIFKALFTFIVAATAAMTVTSAGAAVVCSGVEYDGDATYLGTLNSSANDQCSFTNTGIPDNSFAIDDWWIFQITPTGDATLNAVFNPSSAVSGFDVILYAASGVTCGAIGAPCSYTLGSEVANNGLSGFVVDIPFLTLAEGWYVFHIIGTSLEVQASNLYSGNVTTRALTVPEPSVLALLGLALAGLGFVRRRS